MKRVGIILLDGSEIIIQMHEISAGTNTRLLHSESRDLTYFIPGKVAKACDFIEVIAETSFSGYSMHIVDWKICARNVPESITKDISLATNMAIEALPLTREQELLCKGLLSEF